MFPMTVSIHTPAQLNAVMAALGNQGADPIKANPCVGHATESAKDETKAANKPKKETAQATVADNGASSTPETSTSPADAAAQNPAPEAEPPSATGAESVTYEQAAAAVTNLARSKGRDAAVTVLAKFGASKLPEVKPEDFAAVVDACNKAGA